VPYQRKNELTPLTGNKVCSKCKQEYPRTKEFFRSDSQKRDGFYSSCKECHNTYQRNKKKEDPSYRLKTRISQSTAITLKRHNGSKNGYSSLQFLPYTPQELKEHLENLFEPWMNWDNWGIGKGCWNIDHIIPLNALPFDSLEHPNFLKAWTLENLRPLCAIENMSKGDKIL
jgi:5-methylcytosine-specific restriction endonuclease McrA